MRNVLGLSFAFLIVSVLALLQGSTPAGSVVPPSEVSAVCCAAPATIDSIVKDFEKMEESLFVTHDKFYVQYTSVVAEKKLLKPGEKNPYLSVRYINARKGGTWGISSVLVGDDPDTGQRQEQIYYCTKGNIIDWVRDSNHAVVAPFELGRNMYQDWYFFQYHGLAPFRFIAESNGVFYKDVLDNVKDSPYLEPLKNLLLPDSIKNNMSKYSVLDEQDNIEGHLCWVIEWSQTDKIWIDPKIGGAIRKRIVHWDEAGVVKSIIVNSDYREIQSGIFLPFRQEVTNFVGHEMGLSQSLWGKEYSHFVYEVDSIQFGSFDAEAEKFFDIKLPIGTSVFDLRHETEYTVYDPDHDPFECPIQRGLEANRYVKYRAIGIIIGSILIFIAVWRMLRRMENKHK
jgi:hypothetical protein